MTALLTVVDMATARSRFWDFLKRPFSNRPHGACGTITTERGCSHTVATPRGGLCSPLRYRNRKRLLPYGRDRKRLLPYGRDHPPDGCFTFFSLFWIKNVILHFDLNILSVQMIQFKALNICRLHPTTICLSGDGKGVFGLDMGGVEMWFFDSLIW